MSDRVAVEKKIELSVERCDRCGRWWAAEVYLPASCPCCASRDVKAAEKRAEAAERSARAVRAAAKRKAKR